MTPRPGSQRPPRHLRPATRRWWTQAVADWDFEEHHLRMLTLAAESWDRATAARESLSKHGLTYVDRFGTPKSRPEVAIARDAAVVFARLIRELRLDVEPNDPRVPGLNGGRSARA